MACDDDDYQIEVFLSPKRMYMYSFPSSAPLWDQKALNWSHIFMPNFMEFFFIKMN